MSHLILESQDFKTVDYGNFQLNPDGGILIPSIQKQRLCCFNCNYKTKKGLFLPTDSNKEVDSSIIFCSPACMKRYIITCLPQFSQQKYITNLTLMLIRNKIKIDYKVAPPKQFLKCFGGHMTIEQYRSNCENTQIVQKPFLPVRMLYVNGEMQTKKKRTISSSSSVTSPPKNEKKEDSMFKLFVNSMSKNPNKPVIIPSSSKSTSSGKKRRRSKKKQTVGNLNSFLNFTH
jgi:hypothetical protein